MYCIRDIHLILILLIIILFDDRLCGEQFIVYDCNERGQNHSPHAHITGEDSQTRHTATQSSTELFVLWKIAPY